MDDITQHSTDLTMFLTGGGEMGALMRELDWEATPLGPPIGWPHPLKMLVALLLNSSQPMFVAWGSGRTLLYNNAYAEILAAKHPSALGRDFLDVWYEIRTDLVPIVEEAYAGRPVQMDDIELLLERRGYPEEAHFAFSYTPVRDEAGRVEGFLCPCVEITGQVLAERRRSFRFTLEERLRDLPDPEAILGAALALTADHLGLDRLGYTEIIDDTTVRLTGCHTARGMAPLSGDFPLDSFGKASIARQRQGVTVVCDDVLADADQESGVWAANDTRSMVCVPLVRNGKLRASLYANNRNPRRWTTEQVALLVEVATRTWDAVERSRAEEALRQSEARLSFLDQLRAETAALADADAVLAITTRLVGEQLGVSICAYADMDADQDGFTIRGDWAAPGSTSIVGHYSLADFGKLALKNLGAGQPLVVNDTMRELAPAEAATFQSIGIAATICMPLVKEGHLIALMAIHDKAPRIWTKKELSLLLEVTVRSWAHVERVGSMAELRKSEAQFRAFAQAVPNHAWAARPDGALYWFNEQVLSYSGKDTKSLEGSGWAGIVHPDDLAAAAATWADAIATGRVYESEFRIRRSDGSFRWFLVRAEPVRRTSGAILNWVGTNTDIHDRRSAEGALRALNETLEHQVAERTADRDRMWRLTTDIMLVARFDGTINAINPAWGRLLGWPEDDLVGRAFFDFVHPDDLESTLAEAGKLSDGNTTFRFENRYRSKNGTYLWISWIAVPEEGLIHAVGRDITAEKERQAELEAAKDALRQSQKMEAVGQLTGGLAHDFNNILAGIGGSLEMMRTRLTQGRVSDIDRYLTGATGAVRRAANLTQRLLAFSRRQTLDPKAVDLNALANGMQDLITHSVGPEIDVETVGASGLWTTFVDPGQLENALLNLSVNAKDAMPHGGKLTIETSNRWMDERAGRQRGLAPGQYVSLCVSDTGTGMTPDVIAKAFDPFYTTKPIGQGTGLGLSMVHGFAGQSGGTVKIYSELGKGTMVCIYLPRHLGSVKSEQVEESLEARANTGLRILLVDDEPLVRMVAAEQLEELGYNVTEAGDAFEAIKILQQDRTFSLLVTDVGLPGGMNGRQLAEAAREIHTKLPVLFITGYAENAVLNHGHLDHGMQVLTKPFTGQALAERVEVLASPSSRSK